MGLFQATSSCILRLFHKHRRSHILEHILLKYYFCLAARTRILFVFNCIAHSSASLERHFLAITVSRSGAASRARHASIQEARLVCVLLGDGGGRSGGYALKEGPFWASWTSGEAGACLGEGRGRALVCQLILCIDATVLVIQVGKSRGANTIGKWRRNLDYVHPV